ncbi:M15 family metallopeptidase [Aneurinibacillus sp. REN35]|uniref:M15 family metallopeptidase n=1 Tax=Aneurinibacillus sp. REN35 TaxID=3237286 RepID=UPI003527D234
MKKWFFLFLLLLFLCLIFINELNTLDSKLPDGLYHIVSERSEQLIQQAKTKGIEVMITDDFRSFEEQDRLYAKGRSTEGEIITHAQGGESFHNYGLAIDFAILNQKQQPIWDMTYDGNGNGKSDWLEVVYIAKKIGFEWGGNWQGFKDYPHLQMDFGLSIHDLQRGERPPEQSLYPGK